MSETNKKEAGVQEETEKDLPETEPGSPTMQMVQTLRWKLV